MIDLGKFNLLGIRISAVDYAGALNQIISAAKEKRSLGVSALAVHGVMTGYLDSTHRYRLNDLELIVPDGQAVRWGLNLLHGTKLKDRVYGPNLMLMTCQRAAEEQLPIFLFGGNEQLLSQLRHNLLNRFPDLIVAGIRPSKFRTLDANERSQLIEEITQSGAKITFVGLGCPRQEVWAYEFRQQLSMPVMAVGAAFNFHAGLLSQAPSLMQAWGLEWLYRLMREPRRLWARYLLLNPLYLSLLFLQWTGLRRFDPNKAVRPSTEILYG
jgi:N-acetylglucosaminyldiphosphoundecaprenol N-acetyl-beta-D-mannosaminyltransferase